MKETEILSNEINITIAPLLNIKDETLMFETITTGLIEQHFTECLNFKDKTVRETLIKLGWTPPTNGRK